LGYFKPKIEDEIKNGVLVKRNRKSIKFVIITDWCQKPIGVVDTREIN
jgi:hypothetical protein